MRKHKEALWVFGFLMLWFCLNLIFLTRYPIVHSDESWLGGLTRNMLANGSFCVTEPFFDLKPRYPHAIKILFHLLQMPFILIFGYSVFALRLVSLIAGTIALYLFYRSSREIASFPLSLALTAAISVNAQFIAASHTARQEILLLTMIMLLMLILLRHRSSITSKVAVKLGVITGLSIGLHPNSLLLATGCGVAMLLNMTAIKRFRLKPLLIYIAITGGFALVFVSISLLFDSQFVSHWLMYGNTEFDLLVPVSDKFSEVFGYLSRLWQGISGTYTLPYLKSQLVLCALLPIAGLWQATKHHQHASLTPIGMMAGALIATILIGRYNQLSAILWMFPCLLILPPLLTGHKRFSGTVIPLIALTFAVSAAGPIQEAFSSSYSDYITQISEYVSSDTITLANLNTGFYFDNDALLDVRNLTYLKDNDMTFAEYVESRGIEVIIWSDEMDYIYNHRPNYNVLYGNPRYVPEVEEFLNEQCTLIGSFENNAYGMRLVQVDDTCEIKIYLVNP